MKQLAGMVIIIVLALCLTVTADMVFTRDGHVHHGKISLGPNYTVRVVAPGSTNLITATNLMRAVFGPDVIAMPWHHIGPFGASSFEEAHDKAFFNEAAVDLKKEYGNLKWKEENFIDGMMHMLRAEPNSATYLYRIIHSASPVPLEASLGSDDSIKLWLNDRLVLDNKVLRAPVPDQDRVRLELAKGENKLLIKVANGAAGSQFYFKTQRMKAWRASHAVPNAGIMTWDGSFTPVQVKKVDDEKAYYSNATLARLSVSTIFFRPLSVVEVNKMSNKPAGILLMNGDFVEGELRSMDQKEVVISSVLFGLKKYKPYEEAIALVLRSASKTTVRHHFKLRDGSRLFAKQFGIKDSQITLSAGPFKGRVIPLTQIGEMTYGPVPNLLQGSAIHWGSLPGDTRQSLETRDRNNLSIVQEYSKWRARLAIAKSVTTDEFPPLVKAETEAQAAQTKALSLRDAARQKVTAKTQTYAQAKTVLTAAGSKLDADCHQIDLNSEAVARLISTGQNPNLKKLAEAQQKSITVSLARVINARGLIEVQAEVTRTTAARQAAQSAAKVSEANLTPLKAKLTAAKTVLVAAERDLQAKEKTITDAQTALTNALVASLVPASRAMAAANRQFIDVSQRQIKADQRVLQLNMAMKKATADFQAIDNKAKASVTAVTAGRAKRTTVTTGVTTAKTKLTTATNAVNTAKQALESLQKTQLTPAIAKAEAADKALTLAIQSKPKADQVLADVNKGVAQAMKTLAEVNKLAQTKLEPEQLKKDLAATLALAEQLKVLTVAAQVPIDDINTTRRKAALAIGLASTNSLVRATANKKTADQALTALRENITKATTVHTNAEKAAVAAETKASAALSLATTATNNFVAALKDFESKQTAVVTTQSTMREKFKAMEQPAHAAGITRRVVIEANSNKSRAVSVALVSKTRLAEATASSAAAAAAAKNSTTAASTATTQLKAASGGLTKAESNWDKKKTAADKARTALVTLAAKQAAANAKYALATQGLARRTAVELGLKSGAAELKAQVVQAKTELQKVEQKASDTKDKGEKAALKKQVTKAKTVLRRLTSIDKKLVTSTMAKALTALNKAKAARDAADKALLALNVQVTVATAAVRNATAELDITTAELIDARVKLDQATVNEQLANARSAIAESEVAAAKQALADATAAEKAAKALATATTAATIKAGTGRIAAGKALVAATQQATDGTLAHRAVVKARDESGAKVKMAKFNVNKAAIALADAQKNARDQRVLADKAKEILDDLSTIQQKEAQDRVTAATAAITKAQADRVSANELLKSIEAEPVTLVQTVLQAEQAGATASAIMKTLKADTVSSIKLVAEKNLLMELTRKMVESFVNVNQKWAMDKATAANTALTQAKTNKIEAGKVLMMAKLKVADAVTVLQKAEQAMRNGESSFKVAEMNLAKAQGEQAMAEKLAEEKIKQATGAKDFLTQLTAEQKLAVTAASTTKTILTKATADKANMRQTFNTANKANVNLVLAINTAKQNAQESEAKLKAARISSEKVSEEMRILELQTAAWKEKGVRVEGDLTRLTALRHTPATVLGNTLNTASTQALTNRGNSEKALAATMRQVVTQELVRRAAVELGMKSGAAELKAQLDEENRWKELILAKQEVEQPEADYKKAVEDYQARKKEADAVRSKLSGAQQEINLSNANLTRLKPAYDAVIRP